jgi:hypothetical protein
MAAANLSRNGKSSPLREKVRSISLTFRLSAESSPIVTRATAQTSSLFVILVGGGLAALIVYALATEMGSSNSPTVLYSDACERIKRSQAVGGRVVNTLHIVDWSRFSCNSACLEHTSSTLLPLFKHQNAQDIGIEPSRRP